MTLLTVGQAAAEPTGLPAAFGNTILTTYPDGRQSKVWLNEDGTYSGEGRKHDHSSGVWKAKGDQICMHQRKPVSIPLAYCTAVPAGSVGVTWAAKSFIGEPLVLKLEAGRPN